MGLLSYSDAFFKSVFYRYLPKKLQQATQQRRLKKLLLYARQHSAYYSEAIPENLDFTQIPPIDKPMFIENFDRIVTDKAVTMQHVLAQIQAGGADIDSSDGGKYDITMTSGSTGNPTVIIQDKYFQNMMSVNGFFRAFFGALPVIMVGECDGYGIEAAMIRQNFKKAKFLQSLVQMIDVKNTGIDGIIAKLQKIGPGTVNGYTGVMTIIANQMMAKGIRLKEKRIYLSGEKCTEFDKQLIRRAFDCKDVRVIYGCTEAGSIAFECKEGHLHIASDIVKIEPVDTENNPVGYDRLSDKLLLTNLMNRVQPIIRYEVTDRIILHHGCSCGCKDDWLEIEGRSNDNMIFDTPGGEVSVPSISLLIAMADINKNGLFKFQNYQIAVHRSGQLDFLLDYSANENREEINSEIETCIQQFFAVFGLENIRCTFTAGQMVKTQRGKYKRIYMVKDN